MNMKHWLIRGTGLECCHASNVSYIYRIMLYGANLAFCITLGGSPAAQISTSCCCGQLCWPGTFCLPAFLSYRVLCCWFACVVQPSLAAILPPALWSTPGALPGLLL